VDGDIMGVVEYVLHDGELTVSNILVRPEFRRKGYGSRMMQYLKEKYRGEYEYTPSMKTSDGAEFKHKDIEDLNSLDESKSNKKQYLGQCDLLRHASPKNEDNWHQMMSNKRKISFKSFIDSVDMTKMLDDDENPVDYIKDALRQDSSSAAYVSNWGDEECMFFQTAGFEFIFI